MAFGKTFYTLAEARAHLKREETKGWSSPSLMVRRLSKKVFPRVKKRYHVGTYIDYLNFVP